VATAHRCLTVQAWLEVGERATGSERGHIPVPLALTAVALYRTFKRTPKRSVGTSCKRSEAIDLSIRFLHQSYPGHLYVDALTGNFSTMIGVSPRPL
jgi:hypothetical protein